jgi:hypothetical protein
LERLAERPSDGEEVGEIGTVEVLPEGEGVTGGAGFEAGVETACKGKRGVVARIWVD